MPPKEAVCLEMSVWSCLFGGVCLELSVWTCLLGLVRLSVRGAPSRPVCACVSVSVCVCLSVSVCCLFVRLLFVCRSTQIIYT